MDSTLQKYEFYLRRTTSQVTKDKRVRGGFAYDNDNRKTAKPYNRKTIQTVNRK